MDSMTLAVLFIMAMYVMMFFGHKESIRAQIAAGPDTMRSSQSHNFDGVVYAGQGTSSIPAFNRVGNLIYEGNGMSTPVYNIEGDRVYAGSFSGSPVLTLVGNVVYSGQGASSVPVAVVAGEYAYPGNGVTAAPIAYSPHSDKHLLALVGLLSG